MSSSGRDVPITVLGGSSAFLPALAAALADRASELPRLQVRLVGRDPRRTAIVARFCTLHAEARGVPHHYRPYQDVEAAAEGVPLVINQVRIGGFAGRTQDERLALELGCPGDETIGPGGLASAWRSLRPILEMARQVERVAPEAWLLQVSNPMSMLVAGLLEETGLKTFGLCELPAHTLEQALHLIGRSPSEVESHYVGVNHQGWFVRIEADGCDLLPEILDHGRALPLPYVRLYEHRDREVARMRARRETRGEELARLAARLYTHYAATDDPALPEALSERAMPWNSMSLAPVIVALLGGPPAEAYVSEPNHGHLPFLPREAIVEKRMTVARGGPQPAPACRLPVARTHPEIMSLLSQICEFERLGTLAALRRDRDLFQAALAAHPFGVVEARSGP